jgi:hypothetical protein
MASYVAGNDDVMVGGGWGHGGFGGGMGVLFALLIGWLLFGRDGFRDGHRDGGRRDCECETNCQQDKWIDRKFHDVLAKECAIEKEILIDGGKTRALIEGNYVQDLRDRLMDKNNEVLTLKAEMFAGANFNKLNSRLDAIECHMPKAAPCFVRSFPVELQDCRNDDFRPRRGHCNFGEAV